MRGFFLRFILKGKNRQGLLNIVLIGLLLSSLSLLVLQSVMGGLQSNLKDRSKNIMGEKVIFVDLTNAEKIHSLLRSFVKSGMRFRFENTHEGLVSFNGQILPVVLHGVYEKSTHDKLTKGPYVPYELLDIIGAFPGASIEFYSPSYVDSFFGDRPRSFEFIASDVVTTRVPEFDNSHVWMRAKLLNNFMRTTKLNRIRIYEDVSDLALEKLFAENELVLKQGMIKTWSDLNSSLVWALSLEKIMMTFLFSGMCFLVCLSISSAILVFIRKVNVDLTTLWVLGTSKRGIYQSSYLSIIGICVFSIILGVILGSCLLLFIQHFSGEIMPDIFVERKIPIKFNFSMYLVSIFVPSFLSVIFVTLGLSSFKNDMDYLKNVRSVGQV